MPSHESADGFIALADILRRGSREESPSGEQSLKDALQENDLIVFGEPAHMPEVRAFIEEAALLRLRVIESFEHARKRLLERFAEEVLARELQMRPPDTAAIAQRLLAGFTDESPLTVMVAPVDAPCLPADISVRTDASLVSGDVIVLISEGGMESTLRFRADSVRTEVLREVGLEL